MKVKSDSLDRKDSMETIDRPALVIVDMQNDFALPEFPLAHPSVTGIIPIVENVLNRFRELKRPVFHVVRHHRPDGSDVEPVRKKRFLEMGGYAIPGTAGCNVVEPLTPRDGEYIIAKTRFSAFMHTEFDSILRSLGVNHLVVCGTQYPNCIRMTVFDGISYGYAVTVLTDATAARTKAIAEANILDMKNIGVQCLTVDEFNFE